MDRQELIFMSRDDADVALCAMTDDQIEQVRNRYGLILFMCNTKEKRIKRILWALFDNSLIRNSKLQLVVEPS